MQLKGKKIILTGGTGGIGVPLAKLLREAGAEVLVIARETGDGVIQADLADADGLNKLCDEVSNRHVDILINLAGVLYFGHLEKQKSDQISLMMRVNLEAPIRLAQAVIPGMLKRKSGHIVNVGSVFGALCFPHFVTYSTTKAGLKGFSESLRREYAGKGIVVTHVMPRAVATPLNSGLIPELHKQTKTVNDSPEKVARIIFEAIEKEQKNITIGFPESLFVRLNAVLPNIIDKALVEKRDIADKILNKEENKDRENVKTN